MYEIPLYEAEGERGKRHHNRSKPKSCLTKPIRGGGHHGAQRARAWKLMDLENHLSHDKDTIQKSVAKTGRIILIAGRSQMRGWGAELSAMISEDVFEYLCAPIKRLTYLDSLVPYAPVLEDYVLPQPMIW